MTKQILLIVQFYLGISSSLFAQNTTEEKPLETELYPVVLSATRFPEHQKYVSQKVLNIDSAKIAWLNQPTTAEMLNQTGEVWIQKSQLGGGSPVIRGFEANKVLIAIDGIRMNNAIYRGGHLQNVITIDNAMLEKAEVLYGPSSVMYGSDALGGVMCFYTRKPLLSTTEKTLIKTNTFLRFSSAYDEMTAHADINFGRKKFSALTSLTVSDFGDLRQGSKYYNDYPDWGKRNFFVQQINGKDSMVPNTNPNVLKSTGYRQYDFLQKFRIKTNHAEHFINFQYSTSGNINRYDRLTETNAAGVLKSAEWYYGPQKRMLLSWNSQFNSVLGKGNIIAAYQNIEESRHSRNFGSAQRNHRIENVRALSLNADFRKGVHQYEWNYGAEFTYNKVGSRANAENIYTHAVSALDTRYPDGGSNTQSIAAYSGGLYKLNKQWNFTGGMRYTYNRLSSVFDSKRFFPFPFNKVVQESFALTGNAGINYTPTKSLQISALVSTGFRNPNVDDMSKVFESGGGRIIIPNPDLKPERTINYELRVQTSIKKTVHLNVSGWYTQYRKVITTDFGTFNGQDSILYNGVKSRVITTVNKNKAFLYGATATLNASFKHIEFHTTLSYTYGRILESPDKYPLDHIPPMFGKTGITGKYKKWSAEVYTLYNAQKRTSDYNLRGEDNQLYSADPINGYTPAWITWNMKAGCSLSEQLSVLLVLENITDRFYRAFASGLSGAGRNFSLTIRAGF